MIPKSRVLVSDCSYVSCYGSRPHGYGTWFFSGIGNNGRFEIDFVDMFSNAKKQAIKYASEHDCTFIKVLT